MASLDGIEAIVLVRFLVVLPEAQVVLGKGALCVQHIPDVVDLPRKAYRAGRQT